MAMAPQSQRIDRLFVLFLTFIFAVFANQDYVLVNTGDGGSMLAPDNRKPALYTRDFGDCLGNSTLNVTRFDAAYYRDNMTVMFHLQGNSQVTEEKLMMYIGVFAYGEPRFNLTFDPCKAQLYSMCPMNTSVPIDAYGEIPVSTSDVSGIPQLALTIPDFEGQAILRIFSNASESEIACFASVVTNGVTFAHPKAIGIVVGLFVVAALGASFATSIYGDQRRTMRTHHAHSVSMLVVFAVLHHVYFTGALSMDWPSVLVAFWSNFSWSSGLIYSKSMQKSINHIVSANQGNSSIAGAGRQHESSDYVGGGFNLAAIYGPKLRRGLGQPANSNSVPWTSLKTSHLLQQRDTNGVVNVSDTNGWHGSPVALGLPLPGNYSGFAGLLSAQGIPASNALVTAFLWLIILMVVIAATIATFRLIIWLWSRRQKAEKTEHFSYFQEHWSKFLVEAVSRMLVIGCFAMTTLFLFQLSTAGNPAQSNPALVGIAAGLFVVMLLGLSLVVVHSFWDRCQPRNYQMRQDRVLLVRNKLLSLPPLFSLRRESQLQGNSDTPPRCYTGLNIRLPLFLRRDRQDIQRPGFQDSAESSSGLGWFTAQFRRTRWWFFIPWIFYDIIRAGFYGGAHARGSTQITGLLIVEVMAFIALAILRPFESTRNNVLVTYGLGVSKIFTLALCLAFNPKYALPRIATTAIGVVLIVIQSLLILALLVVIILGVIASYMAITKENLSFRPRRWTSLRQKFLSRMEKAALDLPTQPAPPLEEPQAPYFRVTSVVRQPKIEDERHLPARARAESLAQSRPHANSQSSAAKSSQVNTVDRSQSPYASPPTDPSSIPFGAQVYRASWQMPEARQSSFNSMQSSRHHSCCSYQGPGSRGSPSLSRPLLQTSREEEEVAGVLAGGSQVVSPTPRNAVEIPLAVRKTRERE